MICKNCGAEFDDNLPKCPYCGEFSYAGAEKEYMGRLEDLKEDLEDLEEEIPELYSGELKKQAKDVRKIVLIIGAIILVLGLALFGFNRLMDSLWEYDAKAELLFTKEAYPKADEYYAAGDYDGLLEFYHTSMEENENASFYDWEHYAFLTCYENYDFFKQSAALLGTGDFSDYDMENIFYSYISNSLSLKEQEMNAEEQELVSSYTGEMKEFIDGLGLTPKEQQEFENLLNSSNYPAWDEISDLGKKVYKRMDKENLL